MHDACCITNCSRPKLEEMDIDSFMIHGLDDSASDDEELSQKLRNKKSKGNKTKPSKDSKVASQKTEKPVTVTNGKQNGQQDENGAANGEKKSLKRKADKTDVGPTKVVKTADKRYEAVHSPGSPCLLYHPPWFWTVTLNKRGLPISLPLHAGVGRKSPNDILSMEHFGASGACIVHTQLLLTNFSAMFTLFFVVVLH